MITTDHLFVASQTCELIQFCVDLSLRVLIHQHRGESLPRQPQRGWVAGIVREFPSKFVSSRTGVIN